MRSPTSGFIAEAVLQRLEAIVFQTFTPKLWKRYVDDTFIIIDTYKLEKKKEGNSPFLDILIRRLPTSTKETSAYTKSTHSDVVLIF